MGIVGHQKFGDMEFATKGRSLVMSICRNNIDPWYCKALMDSPRPTYASVTDM